MLSACKRFCFAAATLSLTTAFVCAAQQPDLRHHRKTEYITFAVPNSFETYPTSINNRMTVIGNYSVFNIDKPTPVRAFVRDFSGKMETFQLGTLYTEPAAINDRGEITGVYQDLSGQPRGFVRSPKGVVTTFNPGGAAGSTTPTAINDDGLVTGFYSTDTSSDDTLGFLRYPDGGIVTYRASRDSPFTIPQAINSNGVSTGTYFPPGIPTRVFGFVREADGYITTFPYLPSSINNKGTVAGWNGSASASFQGFVRTAKGKVMTFQLPGQIEAGKGTLPSINRADEVTGSYLAGNQDPTTEIVYGFLRACDGKIKSFSVPRNGVNYTAPAAINDCGVVTGTYMTQAGIAAGFLRIPAMSKMRSDEEEEEDAGQACGRKDETK